MSESKSDRPEGLRWYHHAIAILWFTASIPQSLPRADSQAGAIAGLLAALFVTYAFVWGGTRLYRNLKYGWIPDLRNG